MLSWIFIVLDHLNNNPRVDMSLHSGTLSWFGANKSCSYTLILHAFHIIVFYLPGLEGIRGEQAPLYNSDVVFILIERI
jgi:hypothetical protein